jgi:hypothetical protein
MKNSTKLFLTGFVPVAVILLLVATLITLGVSANRKSNQVVLDEQPRDTVRIETIKTIHDTVWVNTPCTRQHVVASTKTIQPDTTPGDTIHQ